ncbi:MerR family DNA-binding transcriptional regulator [Parvibaculum sp.]|uniref:MerR family transcriptional regulator n=1 Tax=Parvibaculum sp. TaxID=2024848 RepID=UPI002721D646|nr:MerR family DNA-binding transcriptional regulator [Parvibaculum sp.]MDO9126246.1 MerR family DNA-binding transcriptional regulator [Parvibaculum sp.]MDP1626495.1 MerR family DNA-binding transcriptional regulator [Parvibaculum sp.]MDP2150417.1 MerR family DNA-binding transcriptional regulator [Parvibaculum sp.]MDP3329024.1 MerR family DNA-binding transcriptional regulator [Parvibaculum sp.]
MEQQLHAASSTALRRNGAEVSAPVITYSITELAEEFGLTTRAIRFYEDKGLLTPERRGQARVYHPRDRARLTLIVRGKNVGLALAEIKEILSLYDQHDGCETQNRVAVDKFRRRIASLRQQRNEIDLQIRTLEESCARLEAQIVEQVRDRKSEAAPKAVAKPAKTKKPEKAIV